MSSIWDQLLFNRDAIENGQYSSLFTGHFVHLSSFHLLMNLVGLLLITMINRSVILSIKGAFIVGFLCLWTGICVFLFNPEIHHYGGLSGVLHGLFFLAVALNRGYTRAEKILLISGLVVKIVLEQSGLNGSQFLASGERIAVDAHFYGFLAGVIVYLSQTSAARYKLTFNNNNEILKQP